MKYSSGAKPFRIQSGPLSLPGEPRLSNLISFECPRCGAPLQAAEGQSSVKCEYCGGTIVVPPELRPAPAPAPPPRQPTTISVVINTPAGEEMPVWRPDQV